MRVMGIDSAMCNTGWQVMEVDPGGILQYNIPHLTYPLMYRVAGGTVVQGETEIPRLERIISVAGCVQSFVQQYRPELIVLEGALDKGESRSTTGVALYVLLARKWLATTYRYEPKPDIFFPNAVITIAPQRLQSMAHERRSLTGTEVVKKYKSLAPNPPKGRVSQHEADAFFLAYHGLRFWWTKEGLWSKSILTAKENAIFFDTTIRDLKSGRRIASKAMVEEEGISWWVTA